VNLTTSLLPTGAVQLSWGPGSGNLVSYLVEVGTRPGAANIARVNVAAPATSFSGTGSPGTYYLRVRAENTCGLSLPSAEVWIVIGVSVGLPPPPGPPTASASGSTVSVSWTAPVTSDPVTGYVLEAGSAPGLADLATLNVGAVTSYTASNVPAGRYYLRVRATTAAGTGPPSVEVTVEVR
jgi:hypothetical protein